MINFIIFESNEYMRNLYIKVIKKYMFSTNDCYKILEYKNYNKLTWNTLNKIKGKKMYLINVDISGANGFDLARKIRVNGDNKSPIIMFMPLSKKYNIKNAKNILLLNIIEQNNSIIKELYETIEVAFKMLTENSVLTFSSFDELYRIPFDDIYYIEKKSTTDATTIYTKDDSFLLYTSIKNLADKLSVDPRFFRCHRSCILNLHKISSYNSADNTVFLQNGMSTNYVSRQNKKVLKERINKDSVYI